MEPECHTLLKGVCALKGITLSEYVYDCLSEAFVKLIKEDEQVRNMFMAGNYRQGSRAYLLKQSLIEELNSTNDSSA